MLVFDHEDTEILFNMKADESMTDVSIYSALITNASGAKLMKTIGRNEGNVAIGLTLD